MTRDIMYQKNRIEEHNKDMASKTIFETNIDEKLKKVICQNLDILPAKYSYYARTIIYFQNLDILQAELE